jgi:hypothetical protein
MNVTDLLPDQPPDNVRDAVDLFYQGHLIEKPPIFYGVAPPTPLCPFTAENADRERTWQVLALPEEMRPAWGIVTSQTCDICEVGGWDNPFIQVSPVIDLQERLNSDQRLRLRPPAIVD